MRVDQRKLGRIQKEGDRPMQIYCKAKVMLIAFLSFEFAQWGPMGLQDRVSTTAGKYLRSTVTACVFH